MHKFLSSSGGLNLWLNIDQFDTDNQFQSLLNNQNFSKKLEEFYNSFEMFLTADPIQTPPIP